MSYESPITIMHRQLANQTNIQLEGEVLKVVMECNIDVNKDELIKALAYDRDQYVKGYADAEIQLLELENMDEVVKKLNVLLLKNKLTIKGMAGEKLIIIDQTTGEEYIVEDLGYPF